MCLKIFKKSISSKEIEKTKLKDLSLFDTVWVEDNGVVYVGWIFDLSRKHVIVVYGEDLKDYRFRLLKPLTADRIIQDKKILYCNNPNE